ncbi:glycerate kinase family protein [Gordonia soli]|uniref:Putative glycerate kinase n=1 Tax=Gordonia soli NBRC 108243 TaxID=1223545 RepID=M0QMJ1_9ACTN|nr:glycerate kinase [Gordonia soli]GAC69506.1 putative glycerate kinase [Gordonia soli NBRC 108243]
MRVVIAPDSFGDTLSAVTAAHAIGRGWLVARPGDEIVAAPQSDGGPGFVDVLANRFGEVRVAEVSGPLGAGVSARWLFDDRGGDAVAYLECAQACGLHQLGGRPTSETAMSASTRGVGRLLDAALSAGVTTVVVGLGGSATTDGGRGLVEALGGPQAAVDRLRSVSLVVASDVENPLLGEFGAAAVFGPQKGADPATVELLEQRMTVWSQTLSEMAGRDVSAEPGSGAAGGLGAALLALGGRRVSGATVVADATDQQKTVAGADLVITGEGRFDSQTLRGKVVAALTGTAAQAGVPTVVLAGQITLGAAEITEAGIRSAHAVVDVAGSVEVAMADAENQLAILAEKVARGTS